MYLMKVSSLLKTQNKLSYIQLKRKVVEAVFIFRKIHQNYYLNEANNSQNDSLYENFKS